MQTLTWEHFGARKHLSTGLQNWHQEVSSCPSRRASRHKREGMRTERETWKDVLCLGSFQSPKTPQTAHWSQPLDNIPGTLLNTDYSFCPLDECANLLLCKWKPDIYNQILSSRASVKLRKSCSQLSWKSVLTNTDRQSPFPTLVPFLFAQSP